ncbi:MAG: hypothetical protein H7X92_08230, partial [Chitinophagales bacterium]|nr:hypothetical protein [Hyphomicrobiales bacterium]
EVAHEWDEAIKVTAETKNEPLLTLAEYLGEDDENSGAYNDPFALNSANEDFSFEQEEKPANDVSETSVGIFFGTGDFGLLDLPKPAISPDPDHRVESLDAAFGEQNLNPFKFDDQRYSLGDIGPNDAPTDGAPLPNEDIGSLADAVQNALRNVYGAEADTPETARYEVPALTLAPPRGLWDQDVSQARSDVWNARVEDIDDDISPVSAAELDETTTEAVLSYLYSQSDEAVARQRPPSVHALDDLLDAVERNRRDASAAVAPEEFDRADQEAAPLSATAYSSTKDEPAYYRGGSLRSPLHRPQTGDVKPARSSELFAGEAGPAPNQAPWSVETSGRNQVVAKTPPPSRQEQESSRMLGAAGLGLIGGIALAGILSVFLFNSVVSNSEVSESRIAPAAPTQQVIALPEKASVEKSSDRLEPVRSDNGTVIYNPGNAGSAGLLEALNTSGAAPGPIALNVSVNGSFRSENVLVSIKGVPDDGRLSAGIDVGGGTWLLPPQRLAGLQISLPGNASGNVNLEAQVMQSDARTPLSDAKRFAVAVSPDTRDKISDDAVQTALAALQLNSVGGRAAALDPANTASTAATDARLAPTAPKSNANNQAALDPGRQPKSVALPGQTKTSSDPQKSQQLIRDGNRLMRDGDITGARKLYDQAASLGDPDASLAMGRSFDPSYFEQLQVKTGKPDPAQAFDWYMKALDGGVDTAKVKIDTLKQWLLR